VTARTRRQAMARERREHGANQHASKVEGSIGPFSSEAIPIDAAAKLLNVSPKSVKELEDAGQLRLPMDAEPTETEPAVLVPGLPPGVPSPW
jgi:hypothetical protein